MYQQHQLFPVTLQDTTHARTEGSTVLRNCGNTMQHDHVMFSDCHLKTCGKRRTKDVSLKIIIRNLIRFRCLTLVSP